MTALSALATPMMRSKSALFLRFSWMTSCCMFLLWGPSPLSAEEGPQVVDLTPGSVSEEVVQKEARRISRRLGPLVLNEPPFELLQSLQWAIPDPAREQCFDGKSRPRKGKPIKKSRQEVEVAQVDVYFDALLEKARQHILSMEPKQALEALANARTVIPCSEVIISREQLRGLFLHEGVARFFLKDNDFEDAFLNALAIAPDKRFDVGGYPSAAKKAFEKVERKAEKRRAVQVLNNLDDVQVYLNGQLLEGTRELIPGTHLIQVRGPAGRIRSQLVYIPTATEVPLSEVTDFGLTPTSEVRSALLRDVRANRPTVFTLDGLEDYLHDTRQAAVLFAVEPSAEDRSHLRVYLGSVGMVSMRDYVQRSYKVLNRAESRGLRSLNPVAGVGGAVQAVLGETQQFSENGRFLGVQLYAEQPLGTLQVGGRLALYPYRTRPVTDVLSCGAGSSCARSSTTWTLAGGMGYPIYLTNELRLTPGFYLEGAVLPELSLAVPSAETSTSSPVQVLLLDVLAGGATGRLELTQRVSLDGLKLEGGLELAGGVWAAPFQEAALLLFPVIVTARVGFVF